MTNGVASSVAMSILPKNIYIGLTARTGGDSTACNCRQLGLGAETAQKSDSRPVI